MKKEADLTPDEISDQVFDLSNRILTILNGQHRSIVIMTLVEVMAHYLMVTTRTVPGAAQMAGIASAMVVDRLQELEYEDLCSDDTPLQ